MGNSQARRSRSASTATRESEDNHVEKMGCAHNFFILALFTFLCILYESCAWDERTINKLILEKKLAPRFKGTEDERENAEECPICFLVNQLISKNYELTDISPKVL